MLPGVLLGEEEPVRRPLSAGETDALAILPAAAAGDGHRCGGPIKAAGVKPRVELGGEIAAREDAPSSNIVRDTASNLIDLFPNCWQTVCGQLRSIGSY